MLCWIGCSRTADAPSPSADRSHKKPRLDITLLATAREGRAVAEGPAAGAARMLGYWRSREGACGAGERCDTLAISAGDHWAAAVPADDAVARAMHELGYTASLMGAADLALPEADLQRDLTLSGVPHLGEQLGMQLPASKRVERHGIKIDLIGLSKRLLERDQGAPMLEQLRIWANLVHDSGAHVGVVISDACLKDMADVFERHGQDWAFLVLVIAQGCGARELPSAVHSATMLAAGEGFREYSRARLTFDQNTGALLRAQTGLVTLADTPDAPAEDAKLAEQIRGWSARLEGARSQ